jgi:hypothetical protein
MRTKVASLFLAFTFLTLTGASGEAQEKRFKAKVPEFSGADPKETLRWLASVGDKYAIAFTARETNELARQKKFKDAQKVFNKIIGKKVTWSLAVARVDRDGIHVSALRLPGVTYGGFGEVPAGARRENGTVSIRTPYFARWDGGDDWLLGLKEGDIVKVTGEVGSIHWSSYRENDGHTFGIYLWDAVVKPKD